MRPRSSNGSPRRRKRIYGDVIPAHGTDKRIVVIKQPIGVCAAITPWNFPAAMITRKVGPALAAGCTMVLKPASQTPFSALALCVLAEEAGVPKGVFSCVTGSAACDRRRADHEPDRAQAVLHRLDRDRQAADGAVRRDGEEDSRWNSAATRRSSSSTTPTSTLAVKGAIASKYRNAGQTCVCANRILVQDGGLRRVRREAGDGRPRAQGRRRLCRAARSSGPLIDDKAVEKVEEHIADAVAKGARVLIGGKRHALGGTFFEPTVLTDVTTDMLISREETFGPVAPLFRFKTEDEAIAMANDTEFGLAAYFYSRDIGRIWRVAEALEYGMVGINEGLISTEVAPFGGVKESGLGREGSKYGIEDYLEVKYLCMGGI